MRRYDTALRPYTARRIEEVDKADILVGIPAFMSEASLGHVMSMVSEGLFRHFRDKKCVIFVADGGSTDDTRDRADALPLKPWQEKMVTIYRGVAGKGTAFRAIFEAAKNLEVEACVCVDSDLRSINPDWVKYLLEPLLGGEYDFVAPVYSRYKYDGTITNNIVYNLTRALYGKRVRQPIGGDFAFTPALVAEYLKADVWESDVARFGIDIWVTTQAIVSQKRICQANLGVKIHDVKDPGESLGPMFRQVCGTLFSLMETHEAAWKEVRGSVTVPTFGMEEFLEPEPITVNQERMVWEFQEGCKHFGPLWESIFSPDVFRMIRGLAAVKPEDFLIPVEMWVKLLYELAARYHAMPRHRMKMLTIMTPLYLGRVASFINRSREMNMVEAEELVEEQAQAFERDKGYLLEIWGRHEDREHVEKAFSTSY